MSNGMNRSTIGVWFTALAVISCLPVAATAQSAADGFNPGTNGIVYALAVQADGKIVVGGNFTTLGGGGTGTTLRNYIGRLNADGSLDASFDPGANNYVEAVALQPDGKILVGGRFTTLGGGGTGTTPRNFIGRLNADGSLDASFDPGANGLGVKAFAVQADGKIVVGGRFTSLGGGGTGTTARNYIGRLNADGSLDPTFNPGASNYVEAVALQPDRKILVGGRFTTLGGGGTGTTTRNYLGRLNADGSLDSSFNPGATDHVYAVAAQPDGEIVIGGRFTGLGGGTGTTPRNKIGRLNTNGSVDSAFNPGANNDVLALVIQPEGTILVGGTFVSLGGGGTGTTTRRAIGRLNANGSLDTSFDPGANGGVYALAMQADGKILVGGLFAGLGHGAGTTPRNNIGRLYADGSVDTDLDPGADNFVQALAVQADGKILVGGAFTTLGGGGTTTRNHIGRLNADGSLDATFNPGANAQVNVLTLQPDGKILVGGDFFTTLGGGGTGTTPRNALGRLNADGSVDTGFDPGANGFIRALALQADGKILVGGLFTALGGGARQNLGRLNADGSLDASFNPGANDQVWAVAVQADGKILVGGAFTTLGGGGTGSTTRNHVGRLNADGSLDTSFDPGANNHVFALGLGADGRILVGGAFTTLGGGGTGATTRNYTGRLNADGSLDASFNPGASDAVHVLAVQTDGMILVGGNFMTLGGGGVGTTTRGRIGRLNVDGSLDPTFNPGASFVVYGLAVQPDGKVLVGGGFSGFVGPNGPTPRQFIARLTNTDPAVQRLSVTDGGGVVTWLRSGAGPEVWRATFESSIDGATYTSLGSGTRVAGGWQLSGQSLATTQNLFIRARGYYTGSIVESILNAYIDNPMVCPTITLSPASLPPGTATVAYVQTITQSGGDVASTAFAITSGALPPGLALWPTGVLTGTPTQTGSTNFTITATDGNGCSGRAAYTLIIVTGTAPTITTQPLGLTIVSGRTATLSVSATGTAPLTYQWYQGLSPTTMNPIGGGTANTYTTPVLIRTTSYLVQVSNKFGSATSNAAVITVRPKVGTDFDGDRKADLAVFRPSDGNWFIRHSTTGYATSTGLQWGLSADVPVPGDYDGDAIADLAVYRPSTGVWYILRSSTNFTTQVSLQWGLPGDVQVPGDYDGDSKMDLAVYRPATGEWYVRHSSTGYGTSAVFQWGLPSDIPVLGDYDGDGKTDLAVYRPAAGEWYVRQSITGYSTSVAFQWGLPGDVPVPGDFDGDGTTDLAVYRPAGGVWYIRQSTTNFTTSVSFQLGLSTDITVPADYDGDGISDLAVYRPATGTWYIRQSTSNYTATMSFQWGVPSDIPVPNATDLMASRRREGDFDGDGRGDLTVYRPSTGIWFTRHSSTNYGTSTVFQWGLQGDVPVSGDYDGDGKADLAVYRPSTGTWFTRYSSTNYGTSAVFQLGLSGDVTVPGDYDGDGKTDVAVYRPSNGSWYILQSSTNFTAQVSLQWGLPGDVPLAGDYDGDRKSDLAVYRPSDGGWYILQSSTSFTTAATAQWGLSGDIAVPGDYDADRKTDVAVYRPSTSQWFILKSSANFTAIVTSQWGLSGDVPVAGDFDGDGKTDVAVFRPSSGVWYILRSSTNFTTSATYQWGLSGDIPILRRP